DSKHPTILTVLGRVASEDTGGFHVRRELRRQPDGECHFEGGRLLVGRAIPALEVDGEAACRTSCEIGDELRRRVVVQRKRENVSRPRHRRRLSTVESQ